MWVPPLPPIWRCQYSCCVFSCFSAVVYRAFRFIFRIPGTISRPILSLWKLKWTIMRSILQRLREWFNNVVDLEHTSPRICDFFLHTKCDERLIFHDKIFRCLWLIYESNPPANTFTSHFLCISHHHHLITVNKRSASKSTVILVDLPPVTAACYYVLSECGNGSRDDVLELDVVTLGPADKVLS